jgi:hypothetical protein
VGEDAGEPIFNIIYGVVHKKTNVSEETYYQNQLNSKAVGREINGNYFIWETVPNIIGKVRPDNSFEFMADQYGQGCCKVISSYSDGVFYNDSRRGGLLYEGERNLLPIYIGMRVDCDTMKPLKPLTLLKKSVNRKEANKLLGKYKGFFSMCDAVCNTMDIDTFISTGMIIYEEHRSYEPLLERLEKAINLAYTAPIDAMFLCMLALNSGRLSYCIHSDGKWNRPSSPIDVLNNMKLRVRKYLYKLNESVFHEVEHKWDEPLKASDWGYKLLVDGKQVYQYGG